MPPAAVGGATGCDDDRASLKALRARAERRTLYTEGGQEPAALGGVTG